ncbi:MAG: outer membrane lipoprotein-sorting protein [candidate division WOR-3 bacterium]
MRKIDKCWLKLMLLIAIGLEPVFGDQTDQAIQIIEKVDKNSVVNTLTYKGKFLIKIASQAREKEFVGYTKGKDFAYIEFTGPAMDKGKRFLRLGQELWMFLPEVEKSVKIAGHMLRQSIMGSDFSYDDFIENRKLQDIYDIKFLGIDTALNKTCFKLELTAKVPDVNYYTRKVWVDTLAYLPIRAEYYAKSDKLMKEITISDFQKFGNRNFPTKIKMVNKLRQNTYTELTLKDIKIDVPIPTKFFTKAYLERK